ncbi:MAG TPA: prepilin-type N-terminal cleavage/methylation domain-containing protein [Thermoanaerobaculia bacterium]|nr:prepilin-type N-terminal cleavage/methylation domain-containing protein [Thermoanaerobaculia bacterium]
MVPRLQLAAFSTLRRNNAQAVEKAANCRRGTIRGFTILEVLIVVAIIGIIAAIAIANYLNALQRTKQKRTMADIRGIAIAWEARAVDAKAYNAAGVFNLPANTITYNDLTTLLAPTYMRNIPRQDGWGWNLDFTLDQPMGGAQASVYVIRSPGRDGQFTGGGYTPGPTTEFDCDIVYSGGAFVVWPEGTQMK